MTTQQNPDDRSAGLERLTANDRDALAAMPLGWFEALRLPYPRVRRAEYRCSRLERMGLLERRVVGEYPHLRTEFRLRPISALQAAAIKRTER